MDNLPLVLDLVEWIADRPRTYDSVMDAWRTSCPRLAIWEDTLDAGLVRVGYDDQAVKIVTITAAGERFLLNNRNLEGRQTA